MTKKYGWLTLCLGLLIVGFAAVQISYAAPTANSAITGRLVDSNDGTPWGYGAEIMVVQTTGTNTGLKGTGFVKANGTFSITLGTTDELALCASLGGCTAGDNFSNYQVMISYTCDFQTGNGTRPDESTSSDANCPVAGPLGSPDLMIGADVNSTAALVDLPVYKEVQITDTFTGIRNIGDVQTGTGPTAVTFSNVATNSVGTFSPLFLAGFFLAVIGTVTLMFNRKKTVSQV